MPELRALSDRGGFAHPYLDVLADQDWLWGWRENQALGALISGRKSPVLIVLGDDLDDVQSIVNRSVDLAPEVRITLQRKYRHLLSGEISDWDWMGIFDQDQRIQPQTHVLDLGLEHNDEINTFLSQASPTASTPAGDPEILTWHGIRDENGLIAVGAATRWKSGAAVLVSIATDPRVRGRGLATDVTASLTEMFFQRGEHRVTLGLYAGNQAAAKAYTKVGYRLLEEFSSSSR